MIPELSIAITAAQEAGGILMQYFHQKLDVITKADQFDPVTQADTASDEFIRKAIATAFPDDAILSEENPLQPFDYKGRIWMVDPLDGTKDFIAGRDTFSVLIGLLIDNVPTIGVVFLPARNELYYAQKGSGAFRRLDNEDHDHAMRVSSVELLSLARMSIRIPAEEVRPIDSAIEKLIVKDRIAGGSIGSRICDIASNRMDIFVNTNHRASKWDTLASEAILSEAGGILLNLKGQKLDYSQPQAKWEELFVAASTEQLAKDAIQQLHSNA